jgi:HPt (histidine-containing phosphotransfer) domain-containing protein
MPDKIQLSVEPALRELVPGFLANRRKDLEVIGRALTSGNLEAIRVVGHNIRCFSRVYGFEELTALGEEIQQAAADASTLRIAHAQAQLASYLSRIDFSGTSLQQETGNNEKAQP